MDIFLIFVNKFFQQNLVLKFRGAEGTQNTEAETVIASVIIYLGANLVKMQ